MFEGEKKTSKIQRKVKYNCKKMNILLASKHEILDSFIGKCNFEKTH